MRLDNHYYRQGNLEESERCYTQALRLHQKFDASPDQTFFNRSAYWLIKVTSELGKTEVANELRQRYPNAKKGPAKNSP